MWRDNFPEESEEELTPDDIDSEMARGLESDDDGSTESMPILDAGPREGQREMVQARALLEKAERLAAKAPEEDRAELDRLMRNVRTAIEDRNWTTLENSSNALADVLFYLEDA